MNRYDDDPRVTAYVLGELTGEERTAFESQLSNDAELRTAVDELQHLAQTLRDDLAAEPPAVMTETQRFTVAREASARQPVRSATLWWAAGSIAAALLVAVLLFPVMRSRETALSNRTAGLSAVGSYTPADPPSSGTPAPPERQPEPNPAGSSALVEETPLKQTGSVVPVAPKTHDVDALYGQNTILGDVAAAPRESRVEGGRFLERKETGDRQPRPPADVPFNTEAYDRIADNPFVRVDADPLSTFSTDVDTASYSNVRRFLNMNQLPPRDAVRIEELLNYFIYSYPEPSGPHPVGLAHEVATAPWAPDHLLVRIGLKARSIDMRERPAANLVFLLDVSGSMNDPLKLPLVKSGLKLLVDNLVESDRVAIVVYAGASGLVLPPTPGSRKDTIIQAIDSLQPGGSTNGAAGIELAYSTAIQGFIRGGTNRVILMTDGDFNVGLTNEGDLTRLIEEKARSGVFLTVLGFGMGNMKDSTMEKLADQGNGQYGYVDSIHEARRIFVEQMGGTLITVAKDVKLQIEFNPATVEGYRLIGYENRLLRHQEFNDDTKDAGDLGAGHTVTAIYEIVPRGVALPVPGVDPLRYQPASPTRPSNMTELMTVKLRYKLPDGQTSRLLEIPVGSTAPTRMANLSTDMHFASAVAAFGMLLRDSPHKGSASWDQTIELAERGLGRDPGGYRTEFMRLARIAAGLRQR